MKDKSRDARTACTVASDDQFSKDCHKLAKTRFRSEHLSRRVATSPSVDELRSLAEREFVDSYGLFPTCAVFAPGCLTVADGKCADLAENRSLSMAVQLVTLVVGKRSHGSKRCQVKTLLDSGERESCEFRLNDANLRTSTEEALWIRCLKGTIRSFKERRGTGWAKNHFLYGSTAQVPGFKVVIVSSLPAKLGLGSNSALVVALYTFLEAIANTCTGNVMEKMFACQLAERLATNSCKVRASDVLVSIIGEEGRIFAFDGQSLDVDRLNWNVDMDVQLVLVELISNDFEKGRSSSAQRASETRCEQVATAMNTMSRWRAQHPTECASMMGLLFPRETMEMVNDAIVRDERIAKMRNAIERERWEEFGRIYRQMVRRAA
ncbi:hypothetical protein K0M31_015617 [Melipona bicolor]|uniref:GHMP kinase N-terminal domain-containing protein n=1 Tax=Melipona bicolor TaxID=60889 RepID=A0AA40FF97_9HYME|nr:hypothetical protein K0M31_015617 [Melipona bicolor]